MGLISVDEAKRILGLELPELDILVRENRLMLYTRNSGPHDRFSHGSFRELQTDGFYFVDSEIECLLNEHSDNDWVSAIFARKYLDMSPAQFVDFLNRAEVETDLELVRQNWCASNGYSGYCPYFNDGIDIRTVKVYKKSLSTYRRRTHHSANDFFPAMPT